ncbi:MAG: hypothetical protein IJI44_02020 [Erysipelotrichaceae bacterium]|nr:hypothetical protein [Erysipelotrichaceae bacterium]
MKDRKKYFFVGARFFCAEKMLEMGLNIVCFAAVKDSFLAQELERRNIGYVSVENKKQLLDLIRNTEFDILVSNGCPYILPVSDLKKEGQLFINLHPSLLPDLKGMSPVNGSILFGRAQGATCHIMDDGIDTGEIIAQIKVSDKADLPLDLLYQLTFMAEGEAFLKAYERNFRPISGSNATSGEFLYYSRKKEDQLLHRDDGLEKILKKIKAFQVEGQYARLICHEKEYEVRDLIPYTASFPDIAEREDFEIVFTYKKNVVTAYKGTYLLWRLNSADSLLSGDLLL